MRAPLDSTRPTAWRELLAWTDRVANFLDRYTSSAAGRKSAVWFPLAVAAACLAISFFFYAPPLWQDLFVVERCQDYVDLSRHPLTDRALRSPFLAYRITAPVIAYLLGLRGKLFVLLPIAANIVSFAVIFRLMAKATSYSVAVLSCLALAVTATGQIGNTWIGFPDPLTNLAIVICMWTAAPWAIACATLCGMCNDERFVLALPLILMWHAGATGGSGLLPDVWRRVRRPLIGLAAGCAVAVIVRYALTRGWIGPGIDQSTAYLRVRTEGHPVPYMFLGMLLGFRWLWLVPIAAIFAVNSPVRWWIAGGLAFACACSTIPGDHYRSMAQAFPAILLAILVLFQRRERLAQRCLVLAIALCLLTPQWTGERDTALPVYPFPAVCLRWAVGPTLRTTLRRIVGAEPR